MFQTQRLKRILQKRRVATIHELCTEMKRAEITVKQTLAKLDYLTSYNQNSRFYALRSSCQFDRFGIWRHKEAFFTRHSTLAALVLALVDDSEAGHTTGELQATTGVSVAVVLQSLVKKEQLIRVRQKHEYVYLTARSIRRRARQARHRFDSKWPLAEEEETLTLEELKRTVIILLEIIRIRPKTVTALKGALAVTHPRIAPGMVSEVCRRYGIDLKKKIELCQVFDVAVNLSGSYLTQAGESFVFHFYCERNQCPICGRRLEYYKTTKSRAFSSLRHGLVWFRETQLRCLRHRYHPENGAALIYGSSFVRSLVPPGASVAYDVIVEIGKKRFIDFRQVSEVVEELKQRLVLISSTTVSRWTDFFLAAVECLHITKLKKLRHVIRRNGGYLLHIDATTETKSDTVFVCLDRILGTVLLSEKISSENHDEVVKALKWLKKHLGEPLAVMKDMGHAIDGAVQDVFPNVPSRICQFHFLRDIGRDLLGTFHVKAGQTMTKLKINPDLRRMKRHLERSLPSEAVQNAAGVFRDLSTIEHLQPHAIRKHEAVLALSLVNWVLDFRRDTDGLGFPFDLHRVCFYSRLNRARLRLGRYKLHHSRTMDTCDHLHKLEQILARIVDPALRVQIRQLRSVHRWFQKLRSILRFQIKGKTPLATTLGVGTIREVRAYNKGVLDFTKSLLRSKRVHRLTATEQVILKHFQRYQFKLLIPVELAEVLEHLDRTNNFEESLFRDLKRRQRRQVGKKDISREFSFHGPYLPLMYNLTNEHYIDAVIGQIEDLPTRISELNPEHIEHYRRKLHEHRRGPFFDSLTHIRTIDLLPHR